MLLKKLCEQQKELQDEVVETMKKIVELNSQISELGKSEQLEKLSSIHNELNVRIDSLTTETNKIKSIYLENSKKSEDQLSELNKNITVMHKKLETIDLEHLNNLNSKISKLLKCKQTSKIIIPIIFVILFFIFLFICPLSPIYQKTRREKILNDVLDQHYKELCEDDAAIEAIEKCTKILEEWKKNHLDIDGDGN